MRNVDRLKKFYGLNSRKKERPFIHLIERFWIEFSGFQF